MRSVSAGGINRWRRCLLFKLRRQSIVVEVIRGCGACILHAKQTSPGRRVFQSKRKAVSTGPQRAIAFCRMWVVISRKLQCHDRGYAGLLSKDIATGPCRFRPTIQQWVGSGLLCEAADTHNSVVPFTMVHCRLFRVDSDNGRQMAGYISAGCISRGVAPHSTVDRPLLRIRISGSSHSARLQSKIDCILSDVSGLPLDRAFADGRHRRSMPPQRSPRSIAPCSLLSC